MQKNPPLAQLLVDKLLLARELDYQADEKNSAGNPVDVQITGAVLSSAYEQLRKAAEYAEEHLVLQRAIARFLNLNMFLSSRPVETSGRELIVELVHAGYIKNGTIGSQTIETINDLVSRGMISFNELRSIHVKRDTAKKWVIAFMAVEIENMLNPHNKQKVTVPVAQAHFAQSLDKSIFADMPDFENYEVCLYIAIQQALLKSDIDVVRHGVYTLHKKLFSDHDIHDFKDFNMQIDRLYYSDLTIKLKRIVSKNGAPFRVLKSVIDEHTNSPELLLHRETFMQVYMSQVHEEYRRADKRIGRGLIKSIFFIFITKTIVGLSVEVPYDILTRGSVAMMPLLINLLFPPAYMASLKLSFKKPTSSNAQALCTYIETMLYQGNTLVSPPKQKIYNFAKRTFYGIILSLPFVLGVYILHRLEFNWVQMLIFFIFFSTASFLGFRLRSILRDLEIKPPQAGMFAAIRDFLYFPFIVAGQWLAKKYSKVNFVARFLDVGIELPLKTVLRLIRQWIRFLNERHNEIY